MDQKGTKVHDQEVGGMLNFNPSDCSHWKRGEKNVKSVFALAKLAETLNVEVSLIHDLAGGQSTLEEAFFEYKESQNFKKILAKAAEAASDEVARVRKNASNFAQDLLKKAEYTTPPLYIPEIMRFFPFVTTQPIDMIDKLSRILRKRPGQYAIHFCKKELKPQTRMSVIMDLARILFEAERSKFPELGPVNHDLLPFEELVFTAAILVPKGLLANELKTIDPKKNIFHELSNIFWAPKSLIGFQLQDFIASGEKVTVKDTTLPNTSSVATESNLST